MEIQSKHRVIMIIVILALLIIFVPMLFSKRAREKLSSIVIPANPATPAVVSDATTPAVVVPPSVTTPSDSTPQMTITPVTKDQNNTAEQPATTPATLPAASTQTDAAPVDTTTLTVPAPSTEGASTPTTETSAVPTTTTDDDKTDMSDNSTGTVNSTTNAIQPTAMMKPKIKTQILSDAETSRLLAQTKKMASTDLNENIMHSQLAMEKIQAPKHTVHATATTSPTYASAVHHALSNAAVAAHMRSNNASSNNVVAFKAHPKQIAIAKTNARAWVVQMGSFRNANNARRLVAQLQRKGFHAFGYTTQSANQVLTEVYVGPAVEFKQAAVTAQNLNKQVNMKGIVVGFDARKLK